MYGCRLQMFVKICPECGYRNHPASVECEQCSASLLDQPVEQSPEEEQSGTAAAELSHQAKSEKDISHASQQPSELSAPSENQKIYIRRCPCGFENPASNVYCEKCHEDLSYIFPTEKTAAAAQPENLTPDSDPPGSQQLRIESDRISSGTAPDAAVTRIRPDPGQRMVSVRLKSADGRFSELLSQKVTVLGREAQMSGYLSGCRYVSRRHASVVITDDHVIIRDSSSTNGTFVNAERVDEERGAVLNDGDLISLGGIEYRGTRDPSVGFIKVEIS